MIEILSATNLNLLATRIAGCIETVGALIWNALSFSASDDTIARKNCMCFSIEEGSITAAYGSRFVSRVKIRGFRHFACGNDGYASPAELAAAGASMLSGLKVGTLEITLCVPKAWIAIQTVEFPVGAKKHLSELVSYELDRFTPFHPEDAYYDFKILTEDSQKLRVTLAAAKAGLIDSYLEALRAKGIFVNKVTYAMSGAAALLHRYFKCTDAIVLDLKADHYDAAVIRDSSILQIFGDHFPSGELPAIVDALAAEIKCLVDKDNGKGKALQVYVNNPRGIDLTSLGPKIPVPVKQLQKMNITDINKSGNQPEIPYLALGGILESLLPRFGRNAFNLLTKGTHSISKMPITLPLILFVIIAALGGYYLAFPAKMKEARIIEIDRQIGLRKERVKKIESLNRDNEMLEQEINAIHGFKYDNPSMLVLLRELTTILPKDAWLERTKITGTTVTIEGYSNSAPQILPRLESSNYFQRAEFTSPIVKNARMNSDRFSIKMEIKGTKKSEADKTANGKKK